MGQGPGEIWQLFDTVQLQVYRNIKEHCHLYFLPFERKKVQFPLEYLLWKDGKWQDFNFFASLCCWWNKSIFFSVRLCSEVSRCEIHHNILKEKHPFRMTRRGKKWVSSLRFYLFSFQLYPSIILFRAKYHQTPGRGLSLSARAVVVRVAPYGVNTRTPWFPVQMTLSNGK